MARAQLSQAEIAAFRARAVQVATHLFAEHGYAGVTMRAIADELGVSAMAAYRYFANKAEIFSLVRAEAARRFSDAQHAQFTATDNPVERVFRMRDAYVRFALEHPDEYSVLFEAAANPADAHPDVVAQSERAIGYIIDGVKSLIDAGVLQGDPVIIAHQLWALTHGLVSLHLAGKLQNPTLSQLLAAQLPLAGTAPAVRKRTRASKPKRNKR